MADRHKVNPALNALLVSISDLHTDPDNAREHDERNIAAIEASYSVFGQQKPIVANNLGMVIAGNGQLAAAMRLGWTKIACIQFDDNDEARQLAFALADNRTAELATWHASNLSESLARLADADDIVRGSVGFSEEEIRQRINDSISGIAGSWGSTGGELSSDEPEFVTVTLTMRASDRDFIEEVVRDNAVEDEKKGETVARLLREAQS